MKNKLITSSNNILSNDLSFNHNDIYNNNNNNNNNNSSNNNNNNNSNNNNKGEIVNKMHQHNSPHKDDNFL